MLKEIKRELRHIYGAAILFFYYAKWPIVFGLPFLYFYLDYLQNLFLNILWIISLILIIKDFIVMFIRYKKGEKLWK